MDDHSATSGFGNWVITSAPSPVMSVVSSSRTPPIPGTESTETGPRGVPKLLLNPPANTLSILPLLRAAYGMQKDNVCRILGQMN